MLNLTQNAAWIWHAQRAEPDEFADFYADFSLDEAAGLDFMIAADSNYAAWLDGELLAFGQYADYPDFKFYDCLHLQAGKGKHRLAIQVWYIGIDSQTYRKGEAGVIFLLTEGEKVLASSSQDTLSRLSPEYVCHQRQLISGQLGPSFHADCSRLDEWRLPEGKTELPFAPSRRVKQIQTEMRLRPVEKLVLKPRCSSRLVAHGAFRYGQAEQTAAAKMQTAWLSWQSMQSLSGQGDRARRPLRLQLSEGDGIYLIFDLGREEAGFVDFDLEVSQACGMEIGYGEHLVDGRCRTGVRGFAAGCKLRGGRNTYLHLYRRFGCRYLQCFVHTKELTLHYFGLRPTDYPLQVLPFDAGNPLRQKIYDTCLRTLLLCVHEHYEDCPWREQALYTMDSRNQMLCGYAAFGETRMPRACLELMTRGVGENGLMNLCFPAGMDFPIPAFSLMYFIQMREYMDYSGDTSLVTEYYDFLQKLLDVFLDRIDESGLTPSFTQKPCWNFYEWRPTLQGALGHWEKLSASHDAPLNAFLSLALEAMTAICQRLQRAADAEKYEAIRRRLNQAIGAKLFNPAQKLFESFDNRDHGAFSVLTNSLCLLCGAAEGLNTAVMERLLADNGKQVAEDLQAVWLNGSVDSEARTDGRYWVIPNTLSMNCFRFDALLALDREKYAPVILQEIDETYFGMLREGATSFWETIEGEADFDDAGSLCHGWSALPVYYYHQLLGKTRKSEG